MHCRFAVWTLAVVIRVGVQRKLREVFGSRDSAGSSAGRWALSEMNLKETLWLLESSISRRLYFCLLLIDTRKLEHFKQTRVLKL
jgi:hypothetical protein